MVPVFDGKVVVGDPNDPTTEPIVKVPQLSGYNRDEGRGVSLGQKSTPAAFEESVRARFGGIADRVLAVYPHANDSEATQSAYLLPRDAATATHAVFGQARTQSAGQPFYPYLFEHVYPGPEAAMFGTFHTAEVPYVFGILDQQGRPFNAEDRRISEEVQAYWLNFMRTGNPNGKGLPTWGASRADALEVMGLGDKASSRPAASSPERATVLREYVKAAGYRVEWPERTAERVTLKLTAPDGSQHLETWDKTRAITAGLWNGKDNWKKYPQTMLSARCVTSAGRVFAGEVMFGCYEADEADEIMREAVVSEVRSAPQGETVTQRIAEAAGVEVPPESVASETKAKACADMAKSLGMTRADLSAVLTELGIEHDPKFRIVDLGADAIELLFERLDAEALKREEKPEDSQP